MKHFCSCILQPESFGRFGAVMHFGWHKLWFCEYRAVVKHASSNVNKQNLQKIGFMIRKSINLIKTTEL